jgi:SAM-dependent methyltransferase
MALQSYTSHKIGLTGRTVELFNLWLVHKRSASAAARVLCDQFAALLEEVQNLLGQPVSGLDVLEIGCGQRPMNLVLWSRNNRAVGIDSEVIMRSLSLISGWEALRANGAIRVAKSIGRKLLQLDKQFANAFKKAAGIDEIPDVDVRLMDASSMLFPDGSYDIVFSRAVFEHIANPLAVTREVRRVLRRNGTFYCLLHLYTSDSGCHDARIFSNSRRRPPSWSHLRDKYKALVQENTFLNRWSLQQWREMFIAEMPGCRVVAMCDDASAQRRSELDTLRAAGELSSYSDEELLSPTVKVIWTKAD